MRKGIPVSPGVTIGTAYCIEEIFVAPDAKPLRDEDVRQELARFDRAVERTAADLRALERKVAAQVHDDAAKIFKAHQAILMDPALQSKIRKWIADEHLPVASALRRLIDEYTLLFTRTADPYLIERMNDIRDVVVRLSAYTSDVVQLRDLRMSGPLIVIADELLPSQVVALGDVEVAGIVTQAGSQTSHAAIIARSRGIPAVSGVRGILRSIRNGDLVVVDGRTGHVAVDPDPESLSAFRKLEREFSLLKDRHAENRDAPALTRDGVPLELLANINGLEDARSALAMGACGVGLFRTEYFYLTHNDVPDEDEQADYYAQVIQESPGRQVTIRTLDIGGDKTIPYLGHRQTEANPFLGWRSVRLSFEHPEFFTTQIRAVLRAAADFAPGAVKLMFPMVTTLEEVRRLRAFLRRSYRQLESDQRRFGRVPLGIMVEVPAAAVAIDLLLDAVDFVSIGSNDLVQYLMAADRDNPKVSHLCQPLSPAVLRVLRDVIRKAGDAGKSVTLCGEMAGQPRAFLALLGLGLTNFSMSPAFIPSIKRLARSFDHGEARDYAAQALTYRTTQGVKRYLGWLLEQRVPEIRWWDTLS